MPKLQPLPGRVVLEFPKAVEQTSGGIIVPVHSRQRVEIGTVIAIGDPLDDQEAKIAKNIREGDRIPISYGSGVSYFKKVPGQSTLSADEWLADLRVYRISELATKVVDDLP